MKKISTVATSRNKIFKKPKLTIGLDLGDRSSHYCILDEAGSVILEHRLPTTPKRIHQVCSRIPRSRIALEIGTHSPWVSRQLTPLGHESFFWANACAVLPPARRGIGAPKLMLPRTYQGYVTVGRIFLATTCFSVSSSRAKHGK